jgi:hypothetical protein
MNMIFKVLSVLLAATPLFASAQITLLRMSGAEVSAANAQNVTYTVRTNHPGSVALQLLSGDGDVVRRLKLDKAPAGEHQLVWDGKDDEGHAVPDEAYCAQAILEVPGQKSELDDPCKRTGGEVLADIQPQLTPQGDIGYSLSHPARVLIRAGVKGGAMLRSLSVWRPRPAGRNLQRWNGFDESGQVNLRNERLALLVTAFRLPEFTVISTGYQGPLDYRAYRQSRAWPEKPDTPPSTENGTQPLERQGQRIARQHYMARYKDREPRISVTLLKPDGKPWSEGAAVAEERPQTRRFAPGPPSGMSQLGNGPAFPHELRVSVDIHPEDRWLMQESLYEVSFFVDGDFVSEEENGYVPIGWLWNTRSLKPGPHMLTINLTGFTGRVGTKTMLLKK